MKESHARANKMNLSTKFSLSVTLVIGICSLLYLAWMSHTESAAMNSKALAEARALNVEMQAVWTYVDQVQDIINHDSNGVFDFKNIYCSVAGKDVAQKFTKQSEGYVIRYARNNPRSSTDHPDDYESEAIDAFETTNENEYYRVDYSGTIPYFRYVSRIDITYNCLECHGHPEGDYDITGFRKEGMELGDIAGVTSISIPLGLYEEEARSGALQSVVFFLVLAALVMLVVRAMLQKWVTEPLVEMNSSLKSENEAKSDFLAMMSHEFRTPLSSIIAYADILEGASEKKSETEIRSIGEIKENSAVLLNMVNNVIETARLEAGKFDFVSEEIDMVDIIERVRTTVEPIAIRSGVSLTMKADRLIPIIVSDEQVLRIVITNLVSNAIKFTDVNGSVELHAKYNEKNGRLAVSVVDNGCGIPEHDLHRIFVRFEQSDSAHDRSTIGSGLGLALSKSLIDALGGDLTVSSSIGEGSQFCFSVPVGKPVIVPEEEM